jgi:hypothetical protein
MGPYFLNGQVAQSVEQWTENPCVGGSIPSLTTILFPHAAHSKKVCPPLSLRPPACALLLAPSAPVANARGSAPWIPAKGCAPSNPRAALRLLIRSRDPSCAPLAEMQSCASLAGLTLFYGAMTLGLWKKNFISMDRFCVLMGLRGKLDLIIQK